MVVKLKVNGWTLLKNSKKCGLEGPLRINLCGVKIKTKDGSIVTLWMAATARPQRGTVCGALSSDFLLNKWEKKGHLNYKLAKWTRNPVSTVCKIIRICSVIPTTTEPKAGRVICFLMTLFFFLLLGTLTHGQNTGSSMVKQLMAIY